MKLLKIILLCSLLISIVGCMPEQQESIKIGVLFHLSGDGAFWGEGEKNGVLLALEESNEEGGINGVPLEIILEDGETDFPATVSALKKLIEIDGVSVIIGPTWFGQVASPIADEEKKLIISPSTGTVPQPSPYFFNLWPTERQEISPQVKYMKEQGIETVVIVYHLNDWSQSMKDTFVDEATKNGIKIIEEYSLDNDENDFRTILLKIKQSNVDAIYAPFAWYPSQGAFSKQKKELDINIPLYSSSGTENTQLLEAYPSIEGTIYPYPAKGPGEEEFAIQYEEKFGSRTAPPSAYAYDATRLIAEALREGKTTPEEIADYLRAIKEYPGVSNIITFDDNGRITQKKNILKIVSNRRFELLDKTA